MSYPSLGIIKCDLTSTRVTFSTPNYYFDQASF